MFKGRELCIATMHKKEKVIAPILKKSLALKCFTPKEFNSDILGTFSGEIERIDDPIETARKKCKMAIEVTGCELALASEGSFGPHPYIGFIPSDEEILFLYDKKNENEIIVRELSTKTNFDGDDFSSYTKLKEFAKGVLFPSHGIILKDSKSKQIIKGITTWKELEKSFHELSKSGLPIKAETDMRAMFNPTRMEVIKACTEKLLQAMLSECPACNLPGFVATSGEPGLPCEQCNLPTRSALKHIYKCKKCNHEQLKLYPHGKTKEEPTFCDFCNP